jgi:hypothetical protein
MRTGGPFLFGNSLAAAVLPEKWGLATLPAAYIYSLRKRSFGMVPVPILEEESFLFKKWVQAPFADHSTSRKPSPCGGKCCQSPLLGSQAPFREQRTLTADG